MRPHTLLQHTDRDDDEDTEADVFQNPVTRRPWHDERSRRDHYWKPTLKRLGIRWRKAYNTPPHLRDATVALMAGVTPAYIASQLGNSVKMLLGSWTGTPGGFRGRSGQRQGAPRGRDGGRFRRNSSQVRPNGRLRATTEKQKSQANQ
jgi:hypothetical protein